MISMADAFVNLHDMTKYPGLHDLPWLVYVQVVVAMITRSVTSSNALQKQIGCFNRRVVTLAADKLERHWL